jgi:Domain of unknown function (DUF1983).
LDTRVTQTETDITSVASNVTSLESSLTTTNSNVTSNATAISGLDTRVTQTETDITSVASDVTNLTTTVGDNTASISTIATSVDGIEAKYGVTIDNNGIISGFQLLSGAGTPSAFNVRADQFNVYSTDGNSSAVPFAVYTSDRTIDGVVYPAGTYIENAVVTELSALSANIGQFSSAQSGARLVIEDDKLSVYDSNGNLRVRIGNLA